ncbi:flagellar hook-length control protein FliK [Anaerobacillus sp. MEB173]|uniref:flagellar hook-length control protein FliK n=1 Tax=Anaerobacillus sp. MEB173 TaxID=3383345 RepID=UPI003F918FDC
MNIGAMQLLGNSTQIDPVTKAQHQGGSSNNFLAILGETMKDGIIQANSVPNISEENSDQQLLQQLRAIVNDLSYEEAYVSIDNLQSKEVQDLLDQLPIGLAEKIESIFSSGLPVDTLVDSEDLLNNPIHLLSLFIKVTTATKSGSISQNDADVQQNNNEQKTIQLLLEKFLKTLDPNSLKQAANQNFIDEETFIKKLKMAMGTEETLQQNKNSIFPFPLGVKIGMNPLQQFAIHIGDQNQQVMEHQFIRQFQEILGRSSLINFKNGHHELSIKLYPEHLGRLDIRLTQINGEIIARIMTTSFKARELIESQLSQLRQAFGSQQINVERIEISQQQTGQAFSEQQQNKQQSERDDGSHHTQENTNEKQEDSFSDVLEEVTINQKV